MIRQLIRVKSEQRPGYTEYWFIVPGWNHRERVRLNNRQDVPPEIYNMILGGQRHFHAKMNLDAERPDDVVFRDWELNMERWDTKQRKSVVNSKADAFLAEIKEVCRKHGLCIEHEDRHGAFVLVPFTEEVAGFLDSAHLEL